MNWFEAYVQALGGMLDEKKSLMKQSYDLAAKMESETTKANFERRKLELQADLVSYGVKVAMGVNVDEYGRSRSGYEAEMRKLRVKRRHDRRQKLPHPSSPSDPWVGQDGWDSSDESDTDGFEQFRKDRLKSYKVWKKQVFNDVSSDFSSVEAVLEPFMDLKDFWKDGYIRAFVHLSLEEVLNPYLSFELCRWDPLKLIHGDLQGTPIVDGVSLENFEWYNTVLDYSGEENDPDANLIPALVKKIVFPRIEHYVKIWDCSSLTQTKQLHDMLDEAFLFVDSKTDPVMVKLLDVLDKRVLDFAKDFLCHPLSNDTNQNIEGYAGSALQERICRRAVRVATNVKTVAAPYLEDTSLQILLLGIIIQPLLLDLKKYPNPNFGVHVLERLSDLIPENWILAANGEIPELSNGRFIVKNPGQTNNPQLKHMWDRAVKAMRKLRLEI